MLVLLHIATASGTTSLVMMELMLSDEICARWLCLPMHMFSPFSGFNTWYYCKNVHTSLRR